MSFTTNDGTYIGKKRTALVNVDKKESSTEANAPRRPRIPVEFGSKVPHVVRQRYLDKIIDEYITKMETLQAVYDKVSEFTVTCSYILDLQ